MFTVRSSATRSISCARVWGTNTSSASPAAASVGVGAVPTNAIRAAGKSVPR